MLLCFPSIPEKEVTASAQASSSAATWAGWAVTGVSSLTSKLISKAPAGTEGAVAENAPTDQPAAATGATNTAGKIGSLWNLHYIYISVQTCYFAVIR